MSALGLRIEWQKGGDAEIASLEGQAIVVLSSRSAPPGTPLTGALASGTAIQIKVSSCKREPGDDARFRIVGRLFNASRSVKDELA